MAMPTPSERLKTLVSAELSVHGMQIVGDIDYPKGGQRRGDVCRWNASVGRIGGGVVSAVASWDTVSDCVRCGIDLKVRTRRSEAPFMVLAKR